MDDRRMIAYLLGELDEEEQARLEEAYFADDAEFDQLKAVETELIDTYVRGGLDGNQRGRFEARYLARPELRERVELARALANQAGRGAATRPVVQPRSWWRDVLAGGWQLSPAMSALACAALVVAAVAIWWGQRPATTPEAVQATHQAPTAPSGLAAPVDRTPATPSGAPAPASSTRPGSAAPGAFALVLASGLVRSGDAVPTLSVPAGSDTVRIRIDFKGPLFATYRVQISTPEGREVWSAARLASLQPGMRSVAATLPATALKPGDYILTLTGVGGDGRADVIAEYGFLVPKQ